MRSKKRPFIDLSVFAETTYYLFYLPYIRGFQPSETRLKPGTLTAFLVLRRFRSQ